MRKIIFLVFISTLFLLTTGRAKAQNTFGCRYIEITGACALDIGEGVSCDEENGYLADEQKCLDLSSDQAACEAASFACELNEEPPPVTGSNKHYCEVLRGSSTCVVASTGNTCDESNGYRPGTWCSTTSLGLCESVAFDCVTTGGCGDIGGPCCGNLSCYDENISYCNQDTGICEECGKNGQICCPGVFKCKSGQNLYCTSTGFCEPIPGAPRPNESVSIYCNNETGIETAIGCIPFNRPENVAAFFLRWAIGFGGGIVFLLIIYAGFIITTSQGDPKRLQSGKDLLTASVSGVVLLILSVFVLRLLGVDLLGIF